MDKRSDCQLIFAIANTRDRSALAELHKRFKPSAYNLALRLTNDSFQAEEALQNAWVLIWKYADTKTSEENSSRGWVLKIVANASIQARRKSIRSRERDQAISEPRFKMPPMTPAQHAEENEKVGALHKALDALPEFERELVVLYYGAQLSQDEISRALGCPQRTISRRLQHAMKGLRLALLQKGFASIEALLTPDALSRASCSNYTFASTQQSSNSKASVNRPYFTKLAFALPCVIAMTAILFFVNKVKGKHTPINDGGMSVNVPQSTDQESKLLGRWRHDDGSLDRINFLYRKEKKGTNTTASTVVCLLPLEIPATPITLTFKLRPQSEAYEIHGFWSDGEHMLLNMTSISRKKIFHAKQNRSYKFSILFLDHYLVKMLDGHPWEISPHTFADKSTRIGFHARGLQNIEEIELRKLTQKEIPTGVTNFLENLKMPPMEKLEVKLTRIGPLIEAHGKASGDYFTKIPIRLYQSIGETY